MSDVTATVNFIDTNYNLLHTLQICWSSVGECSRREEGRGRREKEGEEGGRRREEEGGRRRREKKREVGGRQGSQEGGEEEEGERRRIGKSNVFLGTNLGHVSAYFVNS